MKQLISEQLAHRLLKMLDTLRGGTRAIENIELISAILLIKRSLDQPEILQVPENARWFDMPRFRADEAGRNLNEVLEELSYHNPGAASQILAHVDFSTRLYGAKLGEIVKEFGRIPLGDSGLEFIDTVGDAYDKVLDYFAERNPKVGGEFHVPRSVVQLMVRLVKPEPDQSVYDPRAGSGGMLLHAQRYVDESSGSQARISLFGEENSLSAWSIARVNLLLHGITEFTILHGDGLSDPWHSHAAEGPMHFDRVLTRIPVSIKYSRREMARPECMVYGWSPENKADLMIVQHVLASLKSDGVAAVVAPYGILFRGGTEGDIRRRIVEDARLEAVVGIGSNAFYGTNVPACVLVLRGRAGLPSDRRGKVLFINAEHEVVTGRTQHRLDPQHIEKMIDVFRNYVDVQGFSRVVSLKEIADNDFNLNIRRYVESNPPEEIRDVRATLFGGVPRRDVEAKAARFRAFGVDPFDLFRLRDQDYLEFRPEGYDATVAQIEGFAALREQQFINLCSQWWEETAGHIADLAAAKRLLMSRAQLMTSFCEDLLPRGILDRFQLAGILATWWSEHHDDLRSLERHGFSGVLDRWDEVKGRAPDQSPAESVLGVLGGDLCAQVKRLVTAERQALVDIFGVWCDRYAISLSDLEIQQEEVADRLKFRLGELGYTQQGL